MPVISRIRFTNAIYEDGKKRYNDEVFEFDGYNGAVLLENGGGKTVFVQLALQAILPHEEVANRKMKEVLTLDGGPAHIAIEWIINQRPRRYVTTAISLYLYNQQLKSHKYVYEYGAMDEQSITHLPFVKINEAGEKRVNSQQEIADYYAYMDKNYMAAKHYLTTKEFHKYIEENYKIIPSEWQKIAQINGDEGDVEKFFEKCHNTTQLVDQLLIPIAEEAYGGDGSKLFVETFKNQRDHFKKHKQLRKDIKESRLAKEHIDQYTQQFYVFHQLQEQSIEKKSEIKCLYHHILGEEESYKLEEQKLLQQVEENKKKVEDIQHKEQSYELMMYQKKCKNAKLAYDTLNNQYETNRQGYQQAQKELIEIKIARYQRKTRTLRSSLDIYNKQLEELNQDQATETLNEQLNQNSRYLKSCYEELIEAFDKKLSRNETEIERYNDDIVLQKKEMKGKSTEKEQLTKQLTRLEVDISNLKNQMHTIARDILDNHTEEDVSKQYEIWMKKTEEISTMLVELSKHKENLYKDKSQLEKKIIEQNEQISHKSNDIATLRERRKTYDEAHEQMTNLLLENDVRWRGTNLYEKEEHIKSILQNRLVKKEKEYDKLLFKERQTKRIIDDYAKHQYYTADPLLYELVEKIKNKVPYIEVGTHFMASQLDIVSMDMKKDMEDYPYWPISIVTLQSEEAKVRSLLEGYVKELRHPILIHLLEDIQQEGMNIIDQTQNILFPSQWKEQQQEREFAQWLQNIREKSIEVDKEHKRLQQEQRQVSILADRVHNFFNDYNYEELKEFEASINDNTRAVKLIHIECDMAVLKVEAMGEDLEKTTHKISNQELSLQEYGRRIRRGKEYSQLMDQQQQLSKKMQVVQQDVTGVGEQLEQLDRHFDQLIDIRDRLKEEKMELKYKQNYYVDSVLYKEVKDSEVDYTDMTLEILEEERYQIKEALNQRQKDRPSIGRMIQSLRKEIEEVKDAIKYERDNYNGLPLEDIVYPIDGEIRIPRLIDESHGYREMMDELKPQLDNLRDKYNTHLVKYKEQREAFDERYSEVFNFIESLEQVKEKLTEERGLIEKEEKQLTKQIGKLMDSIKKVSDALEYLRTRNEDVRFLHERIPVIKPSEEMLRDAVYERKGYAVKAFNQLRHIENQVETQQQLVLEKKRSLIRDLEMQVKNIRLIKLIKDGLDYKQDYQDIIKWKMEFDKRIEQTMKIYEDDLREHDKQMQQYVNHMCAYLKSIGNELAEIPKKTRIKTENKTIQIFEFIIPEWDEEQGKEAIRYYIDWILGELDSDKYALDDGKEHDHLISQSLEKWLHTRQLLNKVMNESIIVKCKKVTNDNQISSRPSLWEASNKWSGGERWSKNMTLFLGLLNYLAEKKQYISEGEKRHRCVIVDNPFGKASSDHILSPVFFVAEKLGFQMIALTAHADGQFIRDYFPVVYSCRLRHAIGLDKQIMDKEKQINQAYFKDTAPHVAMYLSDKEQLGLF